MENDRLVEYRLSQIEKELEGAAESRKETYELLTKIKEDVAVQRAKTSFLGAASGAVASIPALVLSLVGLGGSDGNVN